MEHKSIPSSIIITVLSVYVNIAAALFSFFVTGWVILPIVNIAASIALIYLLNRTFDMNFQMMRLRYGR